MGVGQFLHLGFPELLVVLGHALRLGLLDLVHAVAAHVAHGDAGACSAYCAATLVSSRRRSSFSSGIGSMMMVPLSCGLMPSPLSRIAFSTLPTSDLSQTLMVTMRGSGTFTVPTWLIGVICAVGVDHDRLEHLRRGAPRPQRGEFPLSAAIAPSMRRSRSSTSISISSSAILPFLLSPDLLVLFASF
jgi:hypothetical protein